MITLPVKKVEPTPAERWAAVMAGLTGVRLAIYDELLAGGSIGAGALAAMAKAPRGTLEDALAWLAVHHFVRAEGGTWRGVALKIATESFLQSGPAERPSITPEPQPAIEAPRTESHAGVHDHQVQFFSDV